ncbi:hypothetical protein C8J56DRAFT_755279, partial [Mycena floridula]
SSAYKHFHEPVMVFRDGDWFQKFVCRHNSTIIVHRHRWEDSTGNLTAHVSKCDPKTKGNIAEYASGSTYSAAKF